MKHFQFGPSLDQLKASSHRQIDVAAGDVRLRFITDAPGQDAVYQEKRREAEALQVDPELPLDATPHLTAEATAFGVSRTDKAFEVMAQASSWAQVSALIEARRLMAKAAVTASTTAQDVRNAAAVDWTDIINLGA